MNELHAAGKWFVGALAARDRDGLIAALAPDVRFRYLIPPGPGEIVGAAEAAEEILGWFADADVFEIQSVNVEPLADRMSVRYRFVLHEQDGWEVVEQQTFMDGDGEGRIAAIDLLCSGFRPREDLEVVRVAGMHRFDAGTMGCADGLPQEFRRRITAIPVGDLLEVTARDPAAKEDLPPLARMMGHEVRSVETPGDGRLVITVERKR